MITIAAMECSHSYGKNWGKWRSGKLYEIEFNFYWFSFKLVFSIWNRHGIVNQSEYEGI